MTIDIEPVESGDGKFFIHVVIDGHTMPPSRKSFTNIDEAELAAAKMRKIGRALASGGDRG